ncbi:MAG: PAS domain S-box protein [Bacteroidia bacterium]|nr:PAS domain S-box protein [Bacteroidia bacterium]
MYTKVLFYTGMATVIASLLVLAGWVWDINLLKCGILGISTMKVNSAFGFLFCGIGLMLYLARFPYKNHWVVACSIVPIAIGILSLIEDYYGFNFGIDEFLIPDNNSRLLGSNTPGRMATTTSFCMLLMGAFIYGLPCQNKFIRIGLQWGLHLATLISLVALLGHFFKVPWLYGISAYNSMAFHTAAVVFLFSGAGSLAFPNLGINSIFEGEGLGNQMAIRLFVLSFICSLVLGFIWLGFFRLNIISASFAIELFTISIILTNFLFIAYVTYQTNRIDSQRIVAESSLEKINQNLEKLVKERTAELQELSETLEIATNGANVGVWTIDLEKREVKGNRVFAEILGLKPSDLPISSERLKSFIHPEDLETVLSKLSNYEQLIQGVDLDHRIVTVQGETKFLKIKGTSALNENGKPIRIFGVYLDITDAKHKEEIISTGKDNLRAIVDSTSDIIWSLDLNFCYITANKAFSETIERITGKAPERGDMIFNLYYTNEENQKWRKLYERALRGETFQETFYNSYTNSHIQYTFNPIINAKSEITGVTIRGQDITLQLNYEKELQESANFIETLKEAIPCLIYQFNRNTGKLTYMNSFFEELIGYKKEEINQFPKQIFTLIHPEDLHLIDYLDVQRTIGNASKIVTEMRLKGRSGSYHWINLHEVGLEKPGEKISETIGIGLDITGRIQAEIKLKQEKESAEKLARAKSEFLSVMSHEIRTPMNAVIGFTDLLAKEHPRPDQKEYLDIIQFSTRHLLGLINDVLDYSKIESGKITFELRPFNLQKQVSNMVNLFSSKASEKGIVTRLHEPETPIRFISGDEIRFNQIISNLLGNAVKFTHKGQIDIGYKQIREDAKELEVEFYVQDSGIGIPPNKQAGIFESFSQADEGTSRKYGGTGLGLSISKKLVELQGGKIWLESIPGEGSTFYFTISFQKVEQPQTEVDKTEFAPNIKDLIGMRVLLAEDNTINVILAKRVLEGWKCKVQVAKNGREAFEKVGSGNYDIVLMDLHMPVMDGYEALKAIRQLNDPIKKNIPIIALSANAESELEAEIAQEFTDYMSKPFHSDRLFELLSKFYNPSAL